MEDKYEKAKKRYILSDLTVEQVAEELGLSVNTLRKKASSGKWKAERTKQGKKRTKKAIYKAIERSSTKAAAALNAGMEEELELAKQIMKWIKKALSDDKQFNRHLVTIKEKENTAGIGGSERQWVEEQEFNKIDTKGIGELAKALETVEGIHRRTSRQLTKLEEERLKIERERLAIERERLQLAIKAAGGAGDDNETGIVMMPAVDMQAYEAEQAAILAQYEEGEKNE